MPSKLELRSHSNVSVFLEKDPISMVELSTGNTRFDQVYLHSRYANKKVSDLKTFPGRRRGRALYMPLAEPETIHGVQYTIKNIKGIGADYEGSEFVIDPLHAPSISGWTPRYLRSSARIWGGLKLFDAKEEMENEKFLRQYLKFSPIVGLQLIPDEAIKAIGAQSEEPLVQLTRLCNTTLRLTDLLADGSEDVELEPEAAAICVINFIELHLALLADGRCLHYIGNPLDNIYVDGTYTDAENFNIFVQHNDPGGYRIRDNAVAQILKLLDRLSELYLTLGESDRFYGPIDKKFNTKLADLERQWKDEAIFQASIKQQLTSALF